MNSPTLFIFGLGYTGRALGRRLLAEGWAVAGTCFRQEQQDSLRAEGFQVFPFEEAAIPDSLIQALDNTSHILSTVPHTASGDPVLSSYSEILCRKRDRVWIGYLSTTGVYGNREGEWVDEDSTPSPTTERGRCRLVAERAWKGLHDTQGLPVHVFRLVGIYGPGRNTLLRVLQGKARRIDQPGQIFSRVHLEDVLSVLQASMTHPNPGRIYNVCDDLPTSPAEVVEYACALLGMDPPDWETLEESGMTELGRSFYLDRKRVSNRRIKSELGITLDYPDYRSGLNQLFQAMQKGKGTSTK